jgi:hypothetical protein
MGRPTKQGIDFFSLDCNLDAKLELFITESGAEGFGLLIILFQLIYKGEGYYIKLDDDLYLRMRRESFSQTEAIVSAVENAIKRGIFSKDMVDQFGILTSSGIQKRYFPAAKKKKSVVVDRKFLLIDVSEYNNLIDSDGNRLKSCGNATKEKEKEKEKEEGKGKEFPLPETVKPPPLKTECAAFFRENNSDIESGVVFWGHYEARGLWGSLENWQAEAEKWIAKDKRDGKGVKANRSSPCKLYTSQEIGGFNQPQWPEVEMVRIEGMSACRSAKGLVMYARKSDILTHNLTRAAPKPTGQDWPD